MAQLARTTGRWIAVLVVGWSSLTVWPSSPLGAASLGEWSAHRCAGCAAGTCVPRPTTYGYYRAVWRRWPETTPSFQPDAPAVDAPDTELPSVLDENRFRERTRSDQPLDDGLRQKATPEPPNNVIPDDDLFRTVPETEIPDFDLMRPVEGPADGGGGVLDDFDVDAGVNEPLEFGPADPPADELGLPGLDDPPGDLDLPPFGSNRLRSPKRLALNLTRGHQRNGLVGLAIVPPANASSMKPLARPRAFPKARLDGSVGRASSTEDLLAPETEAEKNQINQISYETEIDQLPVGSASRARNPLRSRRRLDNDGGNKLRNHSAVQHRGIATTTSPAGWAIVAEQADTVARQTRSATPLQRSRSDSVRKNRLRR